MYGIKSFGSGLGLTISNLLAQMLSPDGEGLQLQSTVEVGSAFSFVFINYDVVKLDHRKMMMEQLNL
jgi:hypothetical protein